MLNAKVSVCAVFIFLWFALPLDAKMSAKDSAEKAMISLGEGISDFKYECQGNDVKASCVAKEVVIGGEIKLSNIKLDYMMNNNDFNHAFSFDIQATRADTFLEFMPKKVSCVSPSSLRGKTYKWQVTCDIISSAYALKARSIGSMESKNFINKDVDAIFRDLAESIGRIDKNDAMQDKLKEYKVDPREFVIELRGIDFANKLFSDIKKQDANYTREQYNASVNMGVAMAAVGLANAGISEETLAQLTKATGSLGDIITSKKQQVVITLQRKSAMMLELSGLTNLIAQATLDPLLLLKYLDDYQVSVVAR